MTLINSWVVVPDRSRLQISAQSDNPNDEFVVSARIHDEEGTEKALGDDALRPGPGAFLLRSPHNYAVRLRIGFLSKTNITVVVSATILNPDGSSHGATYREEMVGQNGDVIRVSLFARTQ